MKRVLMFVLLLVMIFLFTGCTNTKQNTSLNEDKVTLTVSAAVSLTDALEEIKEVYETENQVELIFNLGGSGTLAQQIIQGAPVDVFISANREWMDKLDDKGLIQTETRSEITRNRLVLITGKSSPIAYKSFDGISAKDVNKVAIGNPESVPAGKYTKETLDNLHIWDELEDKLVFAKDVRQVLTYVESGNTEIGFVYESDALSSDKVKILATADKYLHNPIIYPTAVITNSKHKQAAIDFIAFVETDIAQDILATYGFNK